MTEILPVTEDSLKEAKRLILRGDAVAFPTETVYGLGANAYDTAAVNKIFEIKGRPNDNPLIVHVHKDFDISTLVADVPGYAKILAEKFLPGPLTMVYRSKGAVSPAVSCGLDTLAIRIPSHEGAQKFLKYVGLPIAAPSANVSKHVSPTSAEHVLFDLNGKIDLILDGGECSGGIESTVLDCTGDIPVVLRSGLVSREMVEEAVGTCGEYAYREGGVARSPGMKYKHYAPACRTEMFEPAQYEQALALYDFEKAKGTKVCIICDGEGKKLVGDRKYMCLGATPGEMASNLYAELREGEKTSDLLIVISPADRSGVMAGVMNRLTKACGKRYEN